MPKNISLTKLFVSFCVPLIKQYDQFQQTFVIYANNCTRLYYSTQTITNAPVRRISFVRVTFSGCVSSSHAY